MSSILRRNPLAVLLAVLMHLAIIAFMLVGVDWLVKPQKPAAVQIIKARVIDASKLQAEVKKLEDTKKQKLDKQVAARKKEEKRLADLKKQREKEKKKLADLERKRIKTEKEQAKKRAEAKKKAATEKKKLADLKKKQVAEKKKLEDMKKARDLADKVRKAKAQAAAERKKKAEVARKKAEAEKKRQAAIAKAMAEKAAKQRELEAQMQAEQDEDERNRIMSQIRAKMIRNWLRPPGTAEMGLKCAVRVRLGTSGSVLLVQVVTSSGNGAFDRSAEAAVRKADPLPMPRSPRLLSTFRDITFVFDPS